MYAKTSFILFCIALCSLVNFGCATHAEKSTLVFDYADFGPQAMAYKVIGPKKLSWQPQAPLILGQGRIFVVVYRDMSQEEVEALFLPDEKNFLDYRFIHYDDAIRYLDSRIAQNLLANVTEQLQQTRQSIVKRWR